MSPVTGHRARWDIIHKQSRAAWSGYGAASALGWGEAGSSLCVRAHHGERTSESLLTSELYSLILNKGSGSSSTGVNQLDGVQFPEGNETITGAQSSTWDSNLGRQNGEW